MKFPRSVSGKKLVKALKRLGYETTRQTGSHVRMTHPSPTQHYITLPYHGEIKLGTLASILSDVATHLDLSRDELIHQLFEK